MVGRLVSFWDGLFSGAMLVSGFVNNTWLGSAANCWLVHVQVRGLVFSGIPYIERDEMPRIISPQNS